MGVAERKEREKEQRRNSIIDAAEEIFFEKGIENATMDEVAKKAEFSKGTLYLYFKNKDEILHAIIARGLEILRNMFKKAADKEKTGILKIRAIGKAYLQFSNRHPQHFEFMQHKEIHKMDKEKIENNPNYAICNQLGNEIFKVIQEATISGIADGSIRKDIDPVKISLVLWGHSAGVLQIVRAKEEMVKQMFNLKAEDIVQYSYNLMEEYMKNKDQDGKEEK